MAGTVLILGTTIAFRAIGQFGDPSIDTSFFRTAPNAPVETSILTPGEMESLFGKESDAIGGDVCLKNGYLTAVIAEPIGTRHANMTVKDVGGALIDLCSNRRLAAGVRGAGGDQLAAFYPGRKAFPYRSMTIGDARGPKSNLVVKAEGTDERPEVVVDYQLNQADPFLTVTSTFANRGAKPLTVALEDDFRADGGKEEMTRTPNGTVDRFWLYDRYWGQAYGLDAEGYKLQLSSDARITTIKYENAAGETSVKLMPGETFSLKRRLYPGTTIFDVQAIAANAAPAMALIRIPSLKDEVPNLSLELSQGDTLIGAARLMKLNMFYTSLPAGDYSARLIFCGNPVGKAQKFQIRSGENEVLLDFDLAWGRVIGTITDTDGGRIPCKVELKPLAEGAKLDFGPETAEFAVRNLIYTVNGHFNQAIPVGKYAVTISHGPEFDIVESQIDVAAGAEVPVKGRLVRTVDTSGWVSSDFHSHSTPSGDNTSSQFGRVLNLVCEHVEFAPCTEHNRVSTYEPHIRELKAEPFIATVSGIELTGSPLPLNHQNAFPMRYTPGIQNNGGPISGPDLETQIERLALWDNRSDKLLQVNHPDAGWMFYDKNGDGKPDGGFERAFPFMNVVEIHPIDQALHLGPTTVRGTSMFHNRVFNWLQLLNQGFRIYGVVNTDSHYNFHGSGFLRNWIQSTTDDPAKIDHMDMVHAAQQGRVVMSNGPFLEVLAQEVGRSNSVVPGQDLNAASGKIALKIRVQCPNWLDVNRLFVLVNGRPHALHDYSREKHPDAFRSGVVKFERTVDIDLKGDAHLIVVTGQTGGNLQSVYGKTYDANGQPTAISNPIFVDIDGNGFQPNLDTLDAPLPVKHPNSK
jgi:hypothetical protein